MSTVVIGFGGLPCRRTVLYTWPEHPGSLSFNDYMTTRSILCFTTNGVYIYQSTFRKVTACTVVENTQHHLHLGVRNFMIYFSRRHWNCVKGLLLEKIINCFIRTSVRVRAILSAVRRVMDCGCAQGLIFYLFVFLSKWSLRGFWSPEKACCISDFVLNLFCTWNLHHFNFSVVSGLHHGP